MVDAIVLLIMGKSIAGGNAGTILRETPIAELRKKEICTRKSVIAELRANCGKEKINCGRKCGKVNYVPEYESRKKSPI